jgi:hypothetical protein
MPFTEKIDIVEKKSHGGGKFLALFFSMFFLGRNVSRCDICSI